MSDEPRNEDEARAQIEVTEAMIEAGCYAARDEMRAQDILYEHDVDEDEPEKLMMKRGECGDLKSILVAAFKAMEIQRRFGDE